MAYDRPLSVVQTDEDGTGVEVKGMIEDNSGLPCAVETLGE
jgi:hypothetical protein